MFNRLILFYFTFAVLILVGCGGSKSMQSADTGDIPEWFTNPPRDQNYFYAANTATSQDLQLAIDKATTGGRAEIGRQVETKVNALQKRFDEEVGGAQDAQILQMFTQASKTVVSTSLSGSRVKSQSTVKDGQNWRAYVLIEYPVGSASQALLQQLKNSQEMYTRYRSSKAFEELDQEAKKYEEWKKTQGN